MFFTLEDLTHAAKLGLIRRRAGQTREETARALQVSPSTVYNWERGKTRSKITFDEELVELSEKEQFYLNRKIDGMTQATLAKELGVSRYWVILMEQGKVDGKRLKKYWGV
jgi:DNA-binding XRE family transcriptional regulator